MVRVIRRLVRWAVLAAVIDVVLRLARDAKQRRLSDREPPVEPPWPVPAPKTAAELDDPTTVAATTVTATSVVEIEEPPPPVELDPATAVVDVDEPPAPVAVEAAWVAANGDGGCPDGYPVKVKVRSGIFHTPGMLNYERTAPDRCYATVEAAEADGFRRAKR